MKLDQYQTIGSAGKSRIDFRHFCAFRGIIAPRSNQVMPSYHRPIAYINTSNSIRISSAPTDEASEFKTVPIAVIHVSTVRASSTGVLRRNQFKGNSLGCGFVLDKELTHSIWPAMHPISHILSLVHTGFTDVSQFFHHYSLCSLLFCPAYKLLRRTMQNVLGYGCFVPRHSLKESTRGTGANRLYFGPDLTDSLPTMIQDSTAKGERLGVVRASSGKNSFNTRVNPNHTTCSLGFWYFYRVGKDEIPNVIALLEFRVTPLLHWWKSFVSNCNWFAPEADALGLSMREVPLPDHRNNFSFKLDFVPLFVRLLGLISTRKNTKDRTGKLRRKFEFCSDGAVKLFMKVWSSSVLGLKHLWRDMITGVKELLAEVIKRLRFPNLDFNCSDSFHYNYLFFKTTEIPLFNLNYFLMYNIRERTAIPPRH